MICPKCGGEPVSVPMIMPHSSFEYCRTCKEDVTKVKVEVVKKQSFDSLKPDRITTVPAKVPKFKIGDKVKLSPLAMQNFPLSFIVKFGPTPRVIELADPFDLRVEGLTLSFYPTELELA